MKTIIYQGPAGRRLDRHLQDSLSLPVGLLHKYLRENKIKLNGRKAPLSTKLAAGDEIRLYLPEESPPAPGLSILYEDEQLLVVDKPAGVLSGDNRQEEMGSLLSQARDYLTARGRAEPDFPPALCHRLDRGTSGVLLIAKTRPMLEWVEGLIRERALRKTYLCVTAGHPSPPTVTLEGFLTKDTARGKVHIHRDKRPDGKPVTTRYQTLATSGRLALLQVELITGRTHQIRAHLASIGTPILGDSKYGDNALNRELHCRRQCLCAVEVAFPATVPADFTHYAGLVIRCPEPWYVGQLRAGELA